MFECGNTLNNLTKKDVKVLQRFFCLYTLDGNSFIDFKYNSKTESVCEFLGEIRLYNTGKRIVFILDNFSSHRANTTFKLAIEHGIEWHFCLHNLQI